MATKKKVEKEEKAAAKPDHWYPEGVNPVNHGIYPRRYADESPHYAFWAGQWFVPGETIEQAEAGYVRQERAVEQRCQWKSA
jgi:hypothetical protein